jgi:hypothetical protein
LKTESSGCSVVTVVPGAGVSGTGAPGARCTASTVNAATEVQGLEEKPSVARARQ